MPNGGGIWAASLAPPVRSRGEILDAHNSFFCGAMNCILGNKNA